MRRSGFLALLLPTIWIAIVNVSSFQDPRSVKPKDITNRADMKSPEVWESFTAKLVGSHSAESKTRVLDVKATTVFYRPSGGQVGVQVAIVRDPETGFAYFVRGRQTMYVFFHSDVLACLLDSGSFSWTKSYLRVQIAPNREQQAVDRFLAEVSDEKLLQVDRSVSRVDLRSSAPFEFFTAGSAGGSQPGIPAVVSVDLAAEVLVIDTMSSGSKHRGKFWIDLAAKRVVRSVIDGKEVVIH
jgi:hypothetical protein